jgi:hypothetical protein
MKLYAVDITRLMLERGHRISVARRGDTKALGRCFDMVPVAHPHRCGLADPKPAEQSGLPRRADLVAAVLPLSTARHLGAVQVRDQLHAVAHAQHWGDVEERNIGGRRILAVDRIRATAQDDARRIPFANPIERARGRMDLGVDASFAHPPRNQLRVL